MKRYTQVLMIMCYLWAGVWVERMIDYFHAGNTEGGLWSILPIAVFCALGALNLVYVKLDAKKEAK